MLTVRRLPASATTALTATRVGDYQASGEPRRAVNGFWDDNGRGVTFTIAPLDDPMPAPGTMTGQLFHIDTFSWDINRAAGLTSYNGKEKGVLAMRSGTATAVPYSNTFSPTEWAGTWDVNHDGWRGVMTLGVTATSSGFTLSGSYLPTGSTTVQAVTGTLRPGSEQVASLTVRGNEVRTYTVAYHAWEDRRAAGNEVYSGARYGAEFVRR